MPTICGIDHIALTVRDVTISVAFYESVLAATPKARMTDGPFTRCVLALPGPTHLGLTEHLTGSGRAFDATTPGLDHLGLAVESRGHLTSWAEHLDSLGIDHSRVQDAAYGSALSFRDPDGNALEFFSPVAGAAAHGASGFALARPVSR